MLSQLDNILFPDRCEVLELVPSQRYLYVIFKNGHSSLLVASKMHRWRKIINQQIKKLSQIDLVLRDPRSRFISGISTFVQTTLRENPQLDRDTVLWFAKNYLFLNRHYASQFSWIVNLGRFLAPDVQLDCHGMEYLKNITDLDLKPEGILPFDDKFTSDLGSVPDLEMFERIDLALSECIGHKLTFEQILQRTKRADPSAYDFVVGKSMRIIKPLYAVS